MNRRVWPLWCALSVGCGPASQYTPGVVARGELTLRYDDAMQIYAGRELLTEGPVYDGLADYVRCVPQARVHAERARGDGRARIGLAWTGGTLGVVALGGIAAGGALYNDRRSAALGSLGAGLGVAALALVFAGTSRILGNSAHGNAVDALNYYNDAVGSVGGTCADPPARPRAPMQPRVPASARDASRHETERQPEAGDKLDAPAVGVAEGEIPR